MHGVLTCLPTAAAVQDLQRLFYKIFNCGLSHENEPPPYHYLTWSRHMFKDKPTHVQLCNPMRSRENNPGICRRPARAKHKIVCQGSAKIIAHAWPTPAIFLFVCPTRGWARSAPHTEAGALFRYASVRPKHPNISASLLAVYCL